MLQLVYHNKTIAERILFAMNTVTQKLKFRQSLLKFADNLEGIKYFDDCLT